MFGSGSTGLPRNPKNHLCPVRALPDVSALNGNRGMRARLWVLALLAVLTLPAVAHAWIIQQTNPFPGAYMAESEVIPLYSNSTSDTIEIHKYFMQMGVPLVLKFTRQAGDHNTIKIADELILNLVPGEEDYEPNWDDFHIRLLNDPNPGAPKVWFKNPTANAPVKAWQQTGGQTRLGGLPASTELDANSRLIGFNWVNYDPNQTVHYGDWGDAPYNQLVIRGLVLDVSQVPVNGTFYMKEWPSAPEPATLVLIGCGFAVVVLRRRNRRAV